MEITPEIAAEMLQHNKNNRYVQNNTVAFYTEQMLRGQWKLNGEAIKFDWNGNLIDGQHRLLAVVNSGVTIQTYVIRNLNPESFDTIDTGRGRSASAVLSCYDIKNYSIIATSITAYLVLLKNSHSAMVLTEKGICKDFRRDAKITNTDILAEYKNSPELYDRASTFISNIIKTQKIGDVISLLKTQAIGGNMIYLIKTKLYPEEKVKEFFAGVNSKKTSDNPAIEQLRCKLLNDAMSPNIKLTAPMKTKLLVKSWNAFISGSTKKLIVKPDEQVEFI